MTEPASMVTHAVSNQAPPLVDIDACASDITLMTGLQVGGADWALPQVQAYGRLCGGDLMALGEAANRHRPQLRTHDRYGHRIDEVEFHPAYHALMATAMQHGVHALSWQSARGGGHVARAALSYLHHQAEAGTSCPLTMTHAAMPVLAMAGPRFSEACRQAQAAAYDYRAVPMRDKPAITIGMGMTEKQGGSDVRANTTRALPQGGSDYLLVGHKWFFSAPMSDAFLVLAQAPGGLSCFWLPRWKPDGTRNALQLMRLKDKLGNWSNASSEVEFAGAHAELIGDEGRGVATILQMVALTRLDCMLGSAAQMRRALIEAIHHGRHRHAFGRALAEQPLMRNVLADLALESMAATAFALRVARAVDASATDEAEAAFARIATAIGKYWVCKRAPAMINEAQECLGGAGYVEESILPRLYREAPLNSIWEGCGNLQCLDVLRALRREPATAQAIRSELAVLRGEGRNLKSVLARVDDILNAVEIDEAGARHAVEHLALALQAAELHRHAPAFVAEAFGAARLGDARMLGFGATRFGAAASTLINQAWPA